MSTPGEGIKDAIKMGMRVRWQCMMTGLRGDVRSGVNGHFIVCIVDGKTISMPLLWSDGVTLTRHPDEFTVLTNLY